MKLFKILILCLLSGCGMTPIKEKQADNVVLIPLKVGNKWVFQNKKDKENIKIAEVVKSEKSDKNTWYLYREFGENFWIRNEGLFQYEVIYSIDQEVLYSKKPEEILALRTDKEEYKVHGTVKYQKCNKPLKTPAGTFDCHIFKFDLDNGYYSINYYSENIGLIYNKFHTADGTQEFELKSYSLK